MSRNTAIAIAVVLILVIGGWFLTRPKPVSLPTPAATSQPTQTTAPVATQGAAVEEESIINISSKGFSPQNLFIKAGESVTWTNIDTENHIVNSAVHPTHSVYPPLNLDLIQPGKSKSLTFPTAGTYKYHDHLNPSLVGSITVQ